MFLLIPLLIVTMLSYHLTLHSTMFLLILTEPTYQNPLRVSLHSTMFLLIPYCEGLIIVYFSPLHSTMFLLIQPFSIRLNKYCSIFTFHNVSINTLVPLSDIIISLNFTFHNVSINTELQYGALNIK